MSEKKEYSKKAFLTEEELILFLKFIDETGITTQEMADIEGLGNRRETIATRIRNKRIRVGFANKIIDVKNEQLKGITNKYEDLKF